MRLELFGTPDVEPMEHEHVAVVPAFRVEGLEAVIERLEGRGVVFTERGREAWGATPTSVIPTATCSTSMNRMPDTG